MSTYRFPLRGKIGVVRGKDGETLTRRIGAQRDLSRANRRNYELADMQQPLTEEEVRNLPVAHRSSS
ncbi:hypothetical protein RLW55_02605 [Hyphomicrobium sp. B1]|uniref:hypothetical protein n=1 Tax=unclassified Hyphomicrobium TaxID=2619925 RepID=UPI000213F8EF|nr:MULTISPECIES: hypothetical protein [unclassified Hyphomicrobium]CCB63585.1 conserved protein of unknown function [Hyphomicrobium sp. MC1]